MLVGWEKCWGLWFFLLSRFAFDSSQQFASNFASAATAAEDQEPAQHRPHRTEFTMEPETFFRCSWSDAEWVEGKEGKKKATSPRSAISDDF
jgi:hypothetical protein